jgi:bifunctional non-homologous end joining protein LigD
MELEQYRKKRDFERTVEPRGEIDTEGGGRMYVIQKHAASHLHYDLRLELGGVLKSWAVPKGPSVDPSTRRLAAHVEDHPVEYGAFEGVIAEGEYGGGTVMLWDRGTWEPEGDPEKDYAKGDLKFTLHGERLKGKWVLVRMKNGGDKNWLLIKKKDNAAKSNSEEPTAQFDRSVASGRTMEEIASRREVWQERAPADGSDNPVEPSTLEGALRAKLPEFIPPELAAFIEAVPNGDNWIHEIKYDGYRIECILSAGRARLISRNGKDWTQRFSAVAEAAASIAVQEAILDGEVVVIDPQGRTDFQALQNILKGLEKGGLSYMVFDIPFCNGWDLTRSPLTRRKQLLRELLSSLEGSPIRFSDHIVGEGETVFQKACGLGLEGIVSKQADSPYEPGRTRRWRKIKCGKRQEFVIGGFTEPGGARSGFGALLVGYYDAEAGLVYCGKVGTGFNDKMLATLFERLKSLEIPRPAFKNPPAGQESKGTHWIRPELVAEVVFGSWTREGKLRQPAFKGLREDKDPGEVVREDDRSEDPPKPSGISTERKASGVKITNPQKVFYPGLGITKGDLIEYYEGIADWIIPHLRRRPLTLVRCPEGFEKECFFQKHLDGSAPPVLRPVCVREKNGEEIYSSLDTIEGVIALVQMGALEIHVWGSRVDKLEQPDLIVFDLDPAQDVDWKRMVEAAFLLRDNLGALGLRSFVKTTGGKGFHIAVPLTPKADWDSVKEFCRAVAEAMVRESPRDFIATMSKAKRKNKIFIDYLRNGRGATSVVAYSTRAKAGCPVSAPVAWDELSEKLRPDSYHIGNIRARLANLAEDPWKDYFSVRQTISSAMRKMVGLP